MEESVRNDVLNKLRQRNIKEIKPFKVIFERQELIIEQNIKLQSENETLAFLNEKLKEDNSILKSKASPESTVHTNEHFLELNRKLFSLQEELTELHKKKGDNAQQVIDLSAAVKVKESLLIEKQAQIESLEAQLVSLKADLKSAGGEISELQSTSQLLKDEYQALQLALSSAETELRQQKTENEMLVQQLLSLKARDIERMDLEHEQFRQKQQQMMQLELAEAAKEQKSVSLSPDKVVVGQEMMSCGDVVPSKAKIKFEAHEGEIMSTKWEYNGRFFATAGADRKIKIWEVSKGVTAELKATLTGSNAAVMSLDFDTTGTIILGASNDFASRVWTVEDSRLRHTLTGHSGKVLSAKFLGDSTRVVSGSHDRTLKVWDLRSKACIGTKFAGSSCNDIVTADQVIISGHFDKKVRLWDNRSSATEPMKEFVVGGKVSSLDISRDLSKLAVCSRDDKIQVLDVRAGGVLMTLGGAGESFHVGCDWSRVSLSPSGEHLAGGGGDGGLYIWSLTSASLETCLTRGHTTTVSAVSWHTGGMNIVSVDKTKTCVIWT